MSEWQKKHPKRSESGWWWYWHPDIVDPVPIKVLFCRDPEDYGWRYLPEKYPAPLEEEWWMPMQCGLKGPDTPNPNQADE